MRSVARDAPLGLHRQVLKDEWTLLLRVALVADLVLLGARPQLLRNESSVLVVAVAAFDQPLVYAMPEGTVELGPCLRMASVAELRLVFRQEVPLRLCVVGRMAAQAANVAGCVCGPREIGVRVAIRVAAETSLAGRLRTQFLEADDLRDVPAALYVRGPRTMAVLAAMLPIL